MEIFELNNRATELINAGRLDDAERVLEEVGRVLAKRVPGQPGDVPGCCDEYFYACHRSELAWRRTQWRSGLPFALRALELEDALWAQAKGEHAYSVGSWAAMSLLTRCSQFEHAEQVLADFLGDAPRFEARLRCRRENAEHALLAGLCLFFEAGGMDWLVRGKKLVALAQERLPVPKSLELTYGYACYHAKLQDLQLALDWLERALLSGLERERARDDEDFRVLRTDLRFIELTSEPRPHLEPKPRQEPLPAPRVHVDEEEWEEHRQRREKDSARAPSVEEVERTRALVGDWRKATIVLKRGTTYGLGSLELTLHGNGRIEADHEPFGDAKGHRAKGRVEPGAMEALFDAFVREAFTELFVGKHCGVPDELHLTLSLRGAKGATASVSKFVRTEHRRFDALVEKVRETASTAVDAVSRKRLTL